MMQARGGTFSTWQRGGRQLLVDPRAAKRARPAVSAIGGGLKDVLFSIIYVVPSQQQVALVQSPLEID